MSSNNRRPTPLQQSWWCVQCGINVDIGDLFLHNVSRAHLHNSGVRMPDNFIVFNNPSSNVNTNPLYASLFSFPNINTNASTNANTNPGTDDAHPDTQNLDGIPFQQLFSSVLSAPLDPNMFYSRLTFRGHSAAHDPYGFVRTLYDYEDDTDDEDDEMEDNEYEANLRLADLIGKVEIGVEDIDAVSSIVDTKSLEHKCPVCMEEFKTLTTNARKLLCSHSFCAPCIETWLQKNKKCPICNVDLEDLRLQTSQ